MPKPPKPLQLMTKHLTKAEIEHREKAEKSLVTGHEMCEWDSTKADKIAHMHWLRISQLYQVIEKNDALIEATLNRYCMILAESAAAEDEDRRLHDLAEKLDDRQGELDFSEYIKLATDINRSISKNQTVLQSKRTMLLSIEKENAMTLVSQLRSIPKKPEKNEKLSGMAAYRQKRAEMS